MPVIDRRYPLEQIARPTGMSFPSPTTVRDALYSPIARPILFEKENPMIRTRGILMAALFALFGTGCFEVEQSIELKRDLSGTANFKLGVDMEPMITIMAKMQKEM